MLRALRRKSHPPAIERFPAAKKSDSGSTSGKWPNKAFALFRLLLALPGPMFLLFTGTQYSRRDQFSGWTGSFTELGAGYTLGVQVLLASVPPSTLSLLLAQIDNTGEALTKNVWTWPRALEVALFLVSISAYLALYYIERLNLFAFGLFLAFVAIGVFLYFATLVLHDVKKYQKLKKYKSFVRSQAVRAGIITMIMACVTTFALSAMLRVPIKATLLNVFVELSLNGIACTDQAAFATAFEASPANASCPALPNCGYATYEDLCQAVQYAPMVRALTDDTFDVNLFILYSWCMISIVILGTGRARADNGYSHLLSPHMLVAILLSLVSLIMTLFSFMRLLLLVLRLSVPRPAPYFDRTDLMNKYELPLTCYGNCISIWFYGKIALYLLILFVLNFDFILEKFASRLRISDEAQKELVDQAIKKLRNQGWVDDAPSFYFIPAEWVRACGTKSLPRMQELRKDKHLEKKNIPLASAFREPAFRGGGIMANILFVSHRWEEKSMPDVNGEQLKAIKEYLEAHPNIERVWFDYSSMPQGDDRTVMEKAEFQLMLAAIADLYLTAHVLILLDGSSASRFWPLMEAWCSMQTVTSEGLRPAKKDERRYTIKCIHTATDKHDGEGLVDKVSTKTPHEMFDHLKNPDVNVTNAKDKLAMLPIIKKTNDKVIEMFKKQASPPASEHVIV
jgi:ABC-type multidrug transport system fused ATPase/permease subunit